jgi:hypothetical protein
MKKLLVTDTIYKFFISLFFISYAFSASDSSIISSNQATFSDKEGSYSIEKNTFFWRQNGKIVIKKILNSTVYVIIASKTKVFFLGKEKIFYLDKKSRLLSKSFPLYFTDASLRAYLVFDSVFISSLDENRYANSVIFDSKLNVKKEFFANKPLANLGNSIIFMPSKTSTEPQKEYLKSIDLAFQEKRIEFDFPKSIECGDLTTDFEGGSKFWSGDKNIVVIPRLCDTARVLFSFDWASERAKLTGYKIVNK